jgi:hypothetical protein
VFTVFAPKLKLRYQRQSRRRFAEFDRSALSGGAAQRVSPMAFANMLARFQPETLIELPPDSVQIWCISEPVHTRQKRELLRHGSISTML